MMEEFNIQTAKKRLFHRITKWYYQGNQSTMECPDVPELVALLQAAGFQLQTIGFGVDPKQKQSEQHGGCRVVVECATSGVRAELTAPGSAACRCSLFSNTSAQPQDVQQQASFWHVTTSQESLNSAGGGKSADVGSSLLPNMELPRQAAIREVLLLLQEELAARPTCGAAARSSQKRRLSATSISSVNHSMESLHVQPTFASTKLENSSSLERRASISCCEDLQRRQQAAADIDDVFLPPHPSSPSIISSSLAVSSDTVNSTFSCDDNRNDDLAKNLKTIIQAATNALAVMPHALNIKPRVIRKDTFNVGDEKMVNENISVKKKVRIAQTPGPSSRVDSLRRRAPKPPIPTPMSKPPVPPGAPMTDPVRRRTIHTTGVREATPPLPRAPRATSSVLEDRAKSSRPLSVLKRLSSVAVSRKKLPSSEM